MLLVSFRRFATCHCGHSSRFFGNLGGFAGSSGMSTYLLFSASLPTLSTHVLGSPWNSRRWGLGGDLSHCGSAICGLVERRPGWVWNGMEWNGSPTNHSSYAINNDSRAPNISDSKRKTAIVVTCVTSTTAIHSNRQFSLQPGRRGFSHYRCRFTIRAGPSLMVRIILRFIVSLHIIL